VADKGFLEGGSGSLRLLQ